jgi:transcriptional regulator with XRE-family HTH domain
MSVLGKNLQRFRKQKGLSLRDLSAKADVDHSHLSRIENGIQELDTISYGVLKGIAKALDVPTPVLIGDHGHKELRRALSRADNTDLRIAEKLSGLSAGDARRKRIKRLLK